MIELTCTPCSKRKDQASVWSWRIMEQRTVRKEPHFTALPRHMSTVCLIIASWLKHFADQRVKQRRTDSEREGMMTSQSTARAGFRHSLPFHFSSSVIVTYEPSWGTRFLGSWNQVCTLAPLHSIHHLGQCQAFLPNLSLRCAYGAAGKARLWNQRCLDLSWLAV